VGGDPEMTITKYGLTCLDWDDDNEVDALVGRQFIVRAKTALICFDPNILSEGADAAEVSIWHCPDGSMPAANPEYECLMLTDAVMTGLDGAPGTQDSCIEVPVGAYFVLQDTDPDVGDEPRVTIQGEGD
jgi:hypothetical protein